MANCNAPTPFMGCADVFGAVAHESCEPLAGSSSCSRASACRHRRQCGRLHRFSDGHLLDGPRAPPLCSASSRGTLSSHRRPDHRRRHLQPTSRNTIVEASLEPSSPQRAGISEATTPVQAACDREAGFASNFVSSLLEDAVDGVIVDFVHDVSFQGAESDDDGDETDVLVAQLVGLTHEPTIVELDGDVGSDCGVDEEAAMLTESCLRSHDAAMGSESTIGRRSLAARLATNDCLEDVQSVESGDASFNVRSCLWAQHVAISAVGGAMYDEGLLLPSFCEVAEQEDICDEEDEAAQKSMLVHEALSCQDLALDYVCGMLDDCILEHSESKRTPSASGEADAAAGPAALQVACPEPRAVSPCTRRGFSRAHCVQEHPPVCAEPFLADCLPSAPIVTSPQNVQVDWSIILSAASGATAAAEEAAGPEPLASQARSTEAASKTPMASLGSVDLSCEQAAASSPNRSIRSSRSKRKIIGAAIRPVMKPSKAMHRLDVDENGLTDSGAEMTTTSTKKSQLCKSTRESSLARNYDALGGVEFHRMDTQDILEHRYPFERKGMLDAPTPTSSSQHSSTRLKMSAMSQDLGETAAVRAFAPQPLRLDVKQFSKSLSTGSLTRVTKTLPTNAQHSGFLPAIQRSSSGSIAWSMNRARASADRRSLASVF